MFRNQRTRLALALCLFVGVAQAANLPPPFCTLYFARLSRVIVKARPVYWPSRYLSLGPLLRTNHTEAKQRVRDIVAAIYEPNSAIGKEIDVHLKQGITKATSNWLHDYFRAYEIFYYSPPYLDVVRRIHEKLPARGTILDLGSGTGGLGQLLVVASPDRNVAQVDHEMALGISRDRLAELFPGEEGRVELIPHYINPITKIPGTRQYEGAVMNHTLYALKHPAKLAALKDVRAKLKSGATFVVNEPLKETAGREEQYRAWMTGVMEQAFTNGSPHSEFDVAIVMAIANGRATRSLRGDAPLERPLLTEAEHEALFREAGFVLESKESTYDGFSRLWTLRVP